MKKAIILVGSLILVMTSCDVKKSKEYQALQRQQDSLMVVNQVNHSELLDMINIIDGIETDFNQIRETEKVITLESKGDGSLSNDRRAKIQMDMEMIKDIIKKNKETIETLNAKLKNSTGEVAGLKKTVERLNAELKARSETIIELQGALKKRDARISELESDLAKTKSSINTLTTKAQKQEEHINTAYYMFGTNKELKDEKVIGGGFLKSTKLLTDNLDKNKYIAIDTRTQTEIPVFSKKAKVISQHPEDSYSFKKDKNGDVVLDITDPERFWSFTKFLIIEVK